MSVPSADQVREAVSAAEAAHGRESAEALAERYAAAVSLWERRDFEAAASGYRDVYHQSRRALGEHHWLTHYALGRTADCLAYAGQWAMAVSCQAFYLDALTDAHGPNSRFVYMGRRILGERLHRAGRLEEAAGVLNDLVEESKHAKNPGDTEIPACSRAAALVAFDRERYDEAARHHGDAVAWHVRHDGPEADATMEAELAYAGSLVRSGAVDDAASRYRGVLTRREAVSGPDDQQTLRVVGLFANDMLHAKRYREALPLCVRLSEARERLYEADDPRVLDARQSVATVRLCLDEFDEAARLFEDVVRRGRRVWGSEHRQTLVSQELWVKALTEAGRDEEEIEVRRSHVEALARAKGPDDVESLKQLEMLGIRLGQVKRWVESLEVFLEVVERRTRVFGADDARRRMMVTLAGNTALMVRRYDVAASAFRETVRWRSRELGDDHPETSAARVDEGKALYGAGLYAQAEKLFWEAARGYERHHDLDHPAVLDTLAWVVMARKKDGRTHAAVDVASLVADGRQRTLGPDHADTMEAWFEAGELAMADDQDQLAADMFAKAAERLARVRGADDASTLATRLLQAVAMLCAGVTPEARRLFMEVWERQREVLGPDHEVTRRSADFFDDFLKE
ncbi:MAG: tetratricopeptide repeat protein [Aeromicrobium sp.]|uniref:tetratricopeptide repeat protein n=1 Tax=Aeromicrobium sp. TaxID=1871063 RepID=UPI0039E4C8AD